MAPQRAEDLSDLRGGVLAAAGGNARAIPHPALLHHRLRQLPQERGLPMSSLPPEQWTREQRAAAADYVRGQRGRRGRWRETLESCAEELGVPVRELARWCYRHPGEEPDERLVAAGSLSAPEDCEDVGISHAHQRAQELGFCPPTVSGMAALEEADEMRSLLGGLASQGRTAEWILRKLQEPEPHEVAREILDIIAPELVEEAWNWGRLREKSFPDGVTVTAAPGAGCCECGQEYVHGVLMVHDPAGVLIWCASDARRVKLLRPRRRSAPRRRAQPEHPVVLRYQLWEPMKEVNARAVMHRLHAFVRRYFPEKFSGASLASIGRELGVTKQALHYHEQQIARAIDRKRNARLAARLVAPPSDWDSASA